MSFCVTNVMRSGWNRPKVEKEMAAAHKREDPESGILSFVLKRLFMGRHFKGFHSVRIESAIQDNKKRPRFWSLG
ncbi:hypothetical protein HMPREF9374_1750 [Desmospora sp. 8437]|uniref:Uncharacterized protein n=1 Tax=Kroppenstedtia eburnea TaxID=714067 RepID=A0A1N7KED9_9BACL|nr:hypothetical protein HMPREF9374_1750 [Desmospora sp. 8437]SIS59953.1 hypothetical protein SAMN05421790_10324 [Kroppenstedtia eburnea]